MIKVKKPKLRKIIRVHESCLTALIFNR
jgi:hypothetical protein